MRDMEQKQRKQRGFSLVELMVAMVVTVVGVMAVSLLILYGIRLQSFSRDATIANAFAKAKMEQLRVTNAADPQRSLGGSLTANVANHFDTPPGTTLFIRRWVVAAGPAGTQDITVAVVLRPPVVPNDPNAQSVQLPPVQIRALLEP